MTFEPSISGDLGKCPFGYRLHKQENLAGVTGDCGYRCCYPTACARMEAENRSGAEMIREARK